MDDDMGILTFVLPGGAENLQISVPGHTIARWTSTPQSLQRKGNLGHIRAALNAEIKISRLKNAPVVFIKESNSKVVRATLVEAYQDKIIVARAC